MRVIKLMVSGDTVHANQYRAGVRGSANAAELVVQFDESWDSYSKKIVFWDALEQHPVERNLIVEEAPRTYRTTIPGEPLALAGECVLVIEGWTDTVRMRAMQVRLKVDDAPDADGAAIPVDPTLTQMEQMQIYVEGKLLDVQTVAGAAEGSAQRAQAAAHEADGSMQAAREYGEMAVSHCEGAAQHAKEAEQHRVLTEGYREEANLASRTAGQSEVAAAGHAQTAKEQAEATFNSARDAKSAADRAETARDEAAGFAAHPPMIGGNGNWWLWDGKEYADSGTPSQGSVVQSETDAKYFNIDYDGIVSLKPEYRGRPGHELDTTFDDTAAIVNSCPYAVSDNGLGKDGSKNAELPEEIVIPEVINGTAVAGFQPGVFYGNFRVKKLTLPNTVVSLPDLFCNEARYLQEVRNTEHIRELGVAAFRNTRIEKALFPNLRAWKEKAFHQCVLLRIADIGDCVDSVPERAFRSCKSLSLVRGGGNVKSIGEQAFCRTTFLRKVPFLPQVTDIGTRAFASSRVGFDWDSLTECTFGDRATPVIDNNCDYWSGVLFVPCEHRLLTLMNQRNPAWKDIPISETGRTYISGCATFALLHIHSAITGKPYDTPMQFIEELEGLGWPSDYKNGFLGQHTTDASGVVIESHAAEAARTLGYAVTSNAGDVPITKERYQELCDKLTFGAYAFIVEGTKTANDGHAVIVYGMNEIGEVLIADSDNHFDAVNLYNEGFTSPMPFQNFTGPNSDIIVIEKLNAPTVRVSETSKVRYFDGADDVLTARVEDGVLFVDGDLSARVENGILYVD